MHFKIMLSEEKHLLRVALEYSFYSLEQITVTGFLLPSSVEDVANTRLREVLAQRIHLLRYMHVFL